MPTKSIMTRTRRLTTSIASACTAILTFLNRSHPVSETHLRDDFHRNAQFWPAEQGEHDEDDTLPALEMASVLVFVYVDRHTNELCVSVDLDTADDRLLRCNNPDETVPMHITVQGNTVFRA